MTQITPASPADIPRLCELLTMLFALEADFAPAPEKQAAGLREIIAHPEAGRILVLREGDAIIGMANLLFTISTACGGKVCMLEDVIVRPEQRGDGLGTALLEVAIAVAQQEGCLRITLLTDRANDGAIRFYQRNGFALSEMIPLRKLLD
ncbi:MAG TPA: GNAT family N-acetyltransferase [Gallionellaceae bacterium]|nr:GNAT family N-acetyltransferase [Gallionellaceae bacterium]